MKHKGLKYIAAGIISWVFDYGTLLLLYYMLHLRLSIATTVAFITGLIVNFTLIKYWVFDKSRRGRQEAVFQSVLYGALTAFNLIITNVVILYLSKRDIGPEFSKILTTAMIALWNFFFYRSVIFKEKDTKGVVESQPKD